MSQPIGNKTSSANRRAMRGSGITGLNLELQLVHLQNMAILRDNMQRFLSESPEKGDPLKMIEMISEAHLILNFIVQEDFKSPVALDIWEFDPNDSLSRDVKNY